MEMDKTSVVGGIAAAAVGAIGAAVAYGALGTRNGRESAKALAAKAKRLGSAVIPSSDAVSINKASLHELTGLTHIGKARAKRILAARPFRSVDELVGRGLVPAEVLERHRDRLTV